MAGAVRGRMRRHRDCARGHASEAPDLDDLSVPQSIDCPLIEPSLRGIGWFVGCAHERRFSRPRRFGRRPPHVAEGVQRPADRSLRQPGPRQHQQVFVPWLRAPDHLGQRRGISEAVDGTSVAG